MVSQRDSVEVAATGKLGEAGACLLAGSLTGNGDAALHGGTRVLRDRVMAYILAHLEDPRLSRSTVAAAHSMSPRTLDRLFGGEEWSVSGYIRHERLEAVRRDLENPALAHRGVSALAARWCFFDAAHFSRCFREAYGFPPSLASAAGEVFVAVTKEAPGPRYRPKQRITHRREGNHPDPIRIHHYFAQSVALTLRHADSDTQVSPTSGPEDTNRLCWA